MSHQFEKGELVRIIQNESESDHQSHLTDKFEFVRTVDDMIQLRHSKNKSTALVPAQSVIRSDYSKLNDEELMSIYDGRDQLIKVDEVSIIKYRTSDNNLYSSLENAQAHERELYRKEVLKRTLEKVDMTLDRLIKTLKDAALLSRADDAVIEAATIDWNKASIEDIIRIPDLVKRVQTAYSNSEYTIDESGDQTIISQI